MNNEFGRAGLGLAGVGLLGVSTSKMEDFPPFSPKFLVSSPATFVTEFRADNSSAKNWHAPAVADFVAPKRESWHNLRESDNGSC